MIKNLKLHLELQLIDAVEVHPCHTVSRGTGRKHIVEQCEEHEAEFWSVYIHYIAGGLDCVADCDTRGEAECLANLIEHIASNWWKK